MPAVCVPLLCFQERQQECSLDSDASRHAAGLAATRLTFPGPGAGDETTPFLCAHMSEIEGGSRERGTSVVQNKLDVVEDLGGDAEERLLDVVGALGGRLDEAHAELLGELLALGGGDRARGDEVGLVADKELGEAQVLVRVDLAGPVLDAVEGAAVRDVVHEDDAVRVAVVALGQRVEPLLSGCVPLCVCACGWGRTCTEEWVWVWGRKRSGA